MSEYKFPTEIVELPSKGHFYVNGHPLSSGKVEIKYMTAKEEDILSSENLIRQGVVIDKLLEALIVDKSIKVNDLLTGDKNAIMVATRILAYGKEYNFEYGGVEQSVDLTELSNKEVDLSNDRKCKRCQWGGDRGDDSSHPPIFLAYRQHIGETYTNKYSNLW